MGFIGIIITTFFGIILTYVIGGNFRKTERVSIGILLGFGFQTFFMFVFYVLGLRFTLRNTLMETFLIGFIAIVFILLIKPLRLTLLNDLKMGHVSNLIKNQKDNFLKSSWIIKIIWITILGLVLSSLVIGIFFPVYGWDSLVLYNFRAQVFVATGGMEDGISRGYFFGYPLMTSLAHTWFYFLKSNPHLFYWSIYVGFLGVSYHCLRPFMGRITLMLTLLILGLLPSTYSGSYFDYTNFPYNVFFLTGILYICRYVADNKKHYLLLAAILTGLSTWVRQTEPFWVISIFSILVLLLAGFKRNITSSFFWIVGSLSVFFLVQQTWRLFEASNIGAGTNISDQAGYAFKSIRFFNPVQLLDVILTTTKKTLPTWQPYLLVAIFISFFARKNIKKAWIFLYFVVMNISLLYFATYTFSIVWQENWKDILDSQQRLSSFIPQLLIIFTAVISDGYVINGIEVFNWVFNKLKSKILE